MGDDAWRAALALARSAAASGQDLADRDEAESKKSKRDHDGGDEAAQREAQRLQRQRDIGWLGSPSFGAPTLLDRLNAGPMDDDDDDDDDADEEEEEEEEEQREENVQGRKFKLLVLLDMNGTLLVRTKRRVGGRLPDVSLNENHNFFREGAVEFCRALKSRADLLSFAFYTSMREKSARPATLALCGGDDEHGRPPHLYERAFNKADSSAENAWDTMRDLEKVWQTQDKIAYGFDATNTIVVDDTPRKMREHPHNVLVVPTYDERALSRANDTALPSLLNYLDRLLQDAARWSQTTTYDVRAFLRRDAFRAPLPHDDNARPDDDDLDSGDDRPHYSTTSSPRTQRRRRQKQQRNTSRSSPTNNDTYRPGSLAVTLPSPPGASSRATST